MNKQKQLSKKLIKLGIMVFVIVALITGLYVGAMMYAEDIAKQKTDTEADYSLENTKLSNLRTQMDTSGEAEKRYATIETDHPNRNFAAGLDGDDGLNEFLRNAKEQYHLGKMALKPVKEVLSDKAALNNFTSHVVLVRPRLALQLQAVTDVHVFSFLDSLRRNAPGFIRIDKLELKRTGDITDDAIAKMSQGTIPLLVDAKIEFTWIRIVPKDSKDATAATATPAK